VVNPKIPFDPHGDIMSINVTWYVYTVVEMLGRLASIVKHICIKIANPKT